MIEKITSPIIGMPARMDLGEDAQYLSRQYGDAIHAAGGVPVILPLLESPRSLQNFARRLDGIILTGSSSDVDPARYGVSKEPGCGPIQPLRDETDFRLLEVAFENRIPTLCICFGMQSLNVYLGGSLTQDISPAGPGAILHNNPASQGKPSHDLKIVPGSVMEELAGGTVSKVNSTHHQALNRVGGGLKIIAEAPDGIIEAVVGSSRDHFLLGVQWHPEKSHAYDLFSGRIFKFFLAQCRSGETDQ